MPAKPKKRERSPGDKKTETLGSHWKQSMNGTQQPIREVAAAASLDTVKRADEEDMFFFTSKQRNSTLQETGNRQSGHVHAPRRHSPGIPCLALDLCCAEAVQKTRVVETVLLGFLQRLCVVSTWHRAPHFMS